MIDIETIVWKNYFIGKKRKILIALGWTIEQIIVSYERDLTNHREAMSLSLSQSPYKKYNKVMLMTGLELAIDTLKKENLEKQLTFFKSMV